MSLNEVQPDSSVVSSVVAPKVLLHKGYITATTATKLFYRVIKVGLGYWVLGLGSGIQGDCQKKSASALYSIKMSGFLVAVVAHAVSLVPP